jgi:hypothetical protein
MPWTASTARSRSAARDRMYGSGAIDGLLRIEEAGSSAYRGLRTKSAMRPNEGHGGPPSDLEGYDCYDRDGWIWHYHSP